MAARAHQQALAEARTVQLKDLDFILTSLEVSSIFIKRTQTLIAFKEPLLQRTCYDLLLHSQRLRLHSAVVTEYAQRELAGMALRDMLLIHYSAMVNTAGAGGMNGPLLEASGVDPLILLQAKAYLDQETEVAAAATSNGAVSTILISPTSASSSTTTHANGLLSVPSSNVDTTSLLSPKTATQSAIFFGK
jgi:hypothetical protein